MPDVPLPYPLDSLKGYDDQYIPPLIQRINYAILILSTLSMIGLSDYLVFKPNNIVRIVNSEGKIPYLWTPITSILIEDNLFFMGIYMFLANYITIKNKSSLE